MESSFSDGGGREMSRGGAVSRSTSNVENTSRSEGELSRGILGRADRIPEACQAGLTIRVASKYKDQERLTGSVTSACWGGSWWCEFSPPNPAASP